MTPLHDGGEPLQTNVRQTTVPATDSSSGASWTLQQNTVKAGAWIRVLLRPTRRPDNMRLRRCKSLIEPYGG
jgi:hypothetical protein